MIILGQSYVAPKEMGGDNTIYRFLKERFGNGITLIPFYGTKIRALTKKESLLQAFRCWKSLKRNDLLFGWGGDICIYTYIINSILHLGGGKKTFFHQNLIVKTERLDWKNKLRFRMYKWALNKRNFIATVNSESLIDYYDSFFKCGKGKFHVVYDSMTLSDEEKSAISCRDEDREPYVFFGGKAFRDVNTFLKIVDLLPNVKFKAVVLPDMLPKNMKTYSNLEVFCNIERHEFNAIMSNAMICCIPLSATVPCGLSVIQKAMLMGIPVVSTITPSMRTIIPDNRYGFLYPQGDAESMADGIVKLLNTKGLYDKTVLNGFKSMERFTPENVARQLYNALNEIKHYSN